MENPYGLGISTGHSAATMDTVSVSSYIVEKKPARVARICHLEVGTRVVLSLLDVIPPSDRPSYTVYLTTFLPVTTC